MTSLPKVSIVVPTRNRRAMLEEAVQSIFAQTFADWELIVVDDASEDSTWSWLEGLKDPRVTKIRLEERHEQCGSRNAGVRAAKGEFLISLDDDDLLPEHALQTHVAVLERFPGAIASVGGWTAFDEWGSRKTVRIIRRRTLRTVWEDVLFSWVAVSGQCMFRTQALKSINGWDETFIRCTDHELWSRLGRLGPIVVLPDIVLFYRVHSGQWRPRNLDEIMTEARAQAVRRTEGRERERGERILRARALFRTASQCYAQAKAAKSLFLYLRVLSIMPDLLRSPLTRPVILSPIMKCLAGGVGMRLGRALRSRINRALGRKIKVTGNLQVDSDGRLHRAAQGSTSAAAANQAERAD
jgi:glycosyltransferase involved in cell wall biosynthesis